MIEAFPPEPAGGAAPVVSMRWQWRQSITRPIRAFQPSYVPVVMIYFAYGALGLIDVTRDLWIKESLSFTPSQLAGIGVWLTLPWTVKMVFGELVDTVPMFGSQRKSYILIGALLMATGLLILAGAAGRWLTFARPDQLYVLGAMLVAIGTVLQDVVADAMSTEVVPRTDTAGNERPDDSVRVELGMVQVLGRLAVSAGVLAVAGLSGWLASFMPRQDVFLIGLIIPAISVAGAFLGGTETMERRPIDWRILGGGIVFGVVVVVLGASGVPFGQEIIFIISMAVVCYMLVLVTAELDHNTRMGILFATIIVLAFRAAPTIGDGYFWWTLDELNFRCRVLRHATPDRRHPVDRRDVDVQPAIDRIVRNQDAALDCGGGYGAVITQYRANLRRAPMDRSRIWLWRPQHRRRRCRGILAVCAAQHGADTYFDRVLCTARPSRDLVRTDGLTDEHRGGGVTVADEISQ